MTIEELRAEIDRIDSDIIRLYGERLETASQIGRYKQEHHLPVSDPARERDVLNKVGAEAGEKNENGVRALFGFLMAQSRTNQMLEGREMSKLGQLIRKSLKETPELFPEKATVACQGVEGAYSPSGLLPSCTARPSRTFFPPLKRACATTASCRLKTAWPDP